MTIKHCWSLEAFTAPGDARASARVDTADSYRADAATISGWEHSLSEKPS